PVMVDTSGTPHYEFVLDINQNKSNDIEVLLSLDELRLYTSPSAVLPTNAYDAGTGKLNGISPSYDMDGGLDPTDDTWVKLNYAFNKGSGAWDLIVDIPTADLGTDGSQYVYLYSKFGVQNV